MPAGRRHRTAPDRTENRQDGPPRPEGDPSRRVHADGGVDAPTAILGGPARAPRRILFFGDLAGTGFGTVTMDLGRALLDRGEDVRFVSQNELGELPEPFASRAYIVNDYRTGYMADPTFRAWKALDGTGWPDAWRPEAVILLGDFYGVRQLVYADDETEAAFKATPTYHYAPIEGVGLPPAWRHLWDFVTPVAMSGFGADEIAKVTGSRPAVVYHGVDPSAFWPVDPARAIRLGSATLRTREACRAYFHLPPAARVMLRTDRNMPRKRYGSLLRAMTPVLAARPDAWLVLHCRSADEGGDIRDLHSKLPRAIAGRVVNTGYHDLMGGIDRGTLNALYNAADLYVSTSAEGFGLTIAEALACGVPAVGMDYSSVPEVIGPAGRVVPITGLIDNEYGHFWAAIDERALGRVAGELLDDPALRHTLGAKGPNHVRSNFTWAAAAEGFAQAIDARLAQERPWSTSESASKPSAIT